MTYDESRVLSISNSKPTLIMMYERWNIVTILTTCFHVEYTSTGIISAHTWPRMRPAKRLLQNISSRRGQHGALGAAGMEVKVVQLSAPPTSGGEMRAPRPQKNYGVRRALDELRSRTSAEVSNLTRLTN